MLRSLINCRIIIIIIITLHIRLYVTRCLTDSQWISVSSSLESIRPSLSQTPLACFLKVATGTRTGGQQAWWDDSACNCQARFPSKRNRLRCVRCVWMETGLNASACVGKQQSCLHCFGRASYWLQAATNRMLRRSSGNHDWLLANASACV